MLRARGDGGDGSPTVIVISSVAGGSGAGQFLDIIEVVKSTAKQNPWSNQFFSILYAPDVFDQLNVTAGMPGNALAAIAETMNGFWTDSPSEATLELLKHQGVAPSYGSAMDRVGAAYPFIVGRSNSKVTFEDQSAVYNAVATSLTAWITDRARAGRHDRLLVGQLAGARRRERAARQLGTREPGAPLAGVLVDGLRPRHARPREVPGVLRRALHPLRDRSDAARPRRGRPAVRAR